MIPCVSVSSSNGYNGVDDLPTFVLAWNYNINLEVSNEL